MKKGYKGYVLIWVLLLVIFNVICFIVPMPAGRTRFSGPFWVGYALVTGAVLGQLLCARFAFREDHVESTFYRIPIVTACYAGTIVSVIVGVLFMLIPVFPVWLCVVLCLVILFFTALAVVKTCAVAEMVDAVDDRVETQLQAMKKMVTDAEVLVSRSAVPEIKAECKKVYEALRYADPMSAAELTGIESSIGLKLGALAAAVSAKDAEQVKQLAADAIQLVQQRNAQCKALK